MPLPVHLLDENGLPVEMKASTEFIESEKSIEAASAAEAEGEEEFVKVGEGGDGTTEEGEGAGKGGGDEVPSDKPVVYELKV